MLSLRDADWGLISVQAINGLPTIGRSLRDRPEIENDWPGASELLFLGDSQ